MVGAVAGCVERREVQGPGADDVAISELRVAPHRGLELVREPLGEGQVVGMAMGDEHDADRLARQALVQGGKMRVVVGTRVDDHDHRAGPDDPGVGPRPGIRSGVRGNDPRDLRQRGW